MFNTNSFSAPTVYTRGAMRELPPHDFAVLEGKNLSEARQGYDFIAYNPTAFRQLLGPQPVIRELHRREDKFAHEVSTAFALHLMTRTELWESCLTLFPEVRACCRCTPLYCSLCTRGYNTVLTTCCVPQSGCNAFLCKCYACFMDSAVCRARFGCRR